MPPKDWLTIAGRSLAVLAGLLFFGFGLAFNPGWANSWPFGLPIYSVWSAGMSILFLLLFMTVAAGLGAVAGVVCSSFGVGLRRGRAIYAGWLAGSCALAVFASLWAFRRLYATSLEMWPNGYNP